MDKILPMGGCVAASASAVPGKPVEASADLLSPAALALTAAASHASSAAIQTRAGTPDACQAAKKSMAAAAHALGYLSSLST